MIARNIEFDIIFKRDTNFNITFTSILENHILNILKKKFCLKSPEINCYKCLLRNKCKFFECFVIEPAHAMVISIENDKFLKKEFLKFDTLSGEIIFFNCPFNIIKSIHEYLTELDKISEFSFSISRVKSIEIYLSNLLYNLFTISRHTELLARKKLYLLKLSSKTPILWNIRQLFLFEKYRFNFEPEVNDELEKNIKEIILNAFKRRILFIEPNVCDAIGLNTLFEYLGRIIKLKTIKILPLEEKKMVYGSNEIMELELFNIEAIFVVPEPVFKPLYTILKVLNIFGFGESTDIGLGKFFIDFEEYN